jgi:epoxyqueuosine reductase
MQFLSYLKARARELGFNLIGITPATPSPHLDAYLRWIDAGMHGAMGYLAREDRVIRRRDLNVILPGVRSIILVGLDYAALNIPQEILSDPLRGRISNYAWGVDYHDLMIPRLESLADWLRESTGQDLAQRVYVDTGAILERSHAQTAGLGFIGKNTLLIHPRRGSYLFLGEILTTYPFDDYDQPHRENMCGSCTRCLAACPTKAFPKPYVLDARRCISYLTIEYKGSIPPELRPLMGNWVYGCDVCQEVCPFVRRFTPETHEDLFRPVDIDRAAPPLVDLLTLTPEGFQERFAGSVIQRIGYERLLRNACIAAGNSAARELLPLLEAIARRSDRLSLAAEHAEWAIGRI